jgi:hypothetical protein
MSAQQVETIDNLNLFEQVDFQSYLLRYFVLSLQTLKNLDEIL